MMIETSVIRETSAPEGLGEDDAKIVHYLRSERPDLLDLFWEHRDRGHRGIVARLLLAILRENLGGIADRNAPLAPKEGELAIELPDGAVLSARVKRSLSLNRFDFEDELTLHDRGEVRTITTPGTLLALIRDLVSVDDATGIERFERELANSAANYTLALAGAELRRRALEPRARAAGVGTALEWVRTRLEQDETFSPLVFFEQLIVDGHTLHPCSKAKMGMAAGDVIRHSPEWEGAPRLSLAAVAKRTCRIAGAEGNRPSTFLDREYPGLTQRAAEALSQAGHDLADFELIPVHPWQAENTIPTLYADAIGRGEVVMIPEATIPTAALVSVRSLAPVAKRSEGKHHLKTPLNVQMTSAVRTVSPASAENGPALSRVLDEILKREGRFGGRFVVLREDLGAYYRPVDAELSLQECATLSKNLAVLFRENPETHALEGEIALPAVALLARSPIGEDTIALELIDRYAVHHGIADRGVAALAFLTRYAEVALSGFLPLMVRYGIGLEGHLQNSVPVFRLDDGEPVRMLVRDLGGVRVLPSRLNRRGLDVAFFPGSAIVACNVDDLRNKVFYSVVQNHLAELIAVIVRQVEIDEAKLWAPIVETARSVFRRLKEDPSAVEDAREDEQALFRPMLPLKALATMRLREEFAHDLFTEVPNPLCEASSE